MKNNPDDIPASPEDANADGETAFHGIPASPGIAIGVVLTIGSTEAMPSLENKKNPVTEAEVEKEIARFLKAVADTRAEILELQNRARKNCAESEAGIFDAHLLIVDDKMLLEEVDKGIRGKHLAAETVFTQTIQRYISAIASVNDQYLRERAADVSDVASRIIGHLSGVGRPLLDHLPGQRIIISKDLTPSDTVMLDRENVQAFATETGSRTSHSAILARSMKIPAVVGIPDFVSRLHNGDMVIVDGFLGIVIANPRRQTLELYAQKEAFKEKLYNEMLHENQLRPETLDGYRIQLAANLDNADSVGDIESSGAAGIGLFRTEYLFLNGGKIPSEEEQFAVYRKLAEAMDASPVIIRTLDLGGDKLSSAINIQHEPNPFLGLRSIRLCLEYPQFLLPQLRAILRASAFGPVKMMFPMITCEDELDRLYILLDQVKLELKRAKIKFDESMEVGIMIETPAAALIPERFAKKADFFSIGTNDLVQYTMAVDRGNEKVASLYRPLHPVILNLINRVVRAADEAGIWVSICGEMASDPRYIPLLLGLGVQELSMSPVALGMARRVIRKIKIHDAERLAAQALVCHDHRQVLAMAENMLREIAPDIVSLSMKGV